MNLKLTGNTEPVEFDHLHDLTSRIHQWLGNNDLHDEISLYSFGWLQGGRAKNGKLSFPSGANWRISFWDVSYSKRLINGIMSDPEVLDGMRVYEAKEQDVPNFSGCYRFKVDGPVVARQMRDDGSRQYLLHDDDEVNEVLTGTLKHKLEKAGLEEEASEASVQFDQTYQSPHTKLAKIKGVKHKGSICPVVVSGSPEVVRFAWEVGVGELTGSGFGALQ